MSSFSSSQIELGPSSAEVVTVEPDLDAIAEIFSECLPFVIKNVSLLGSKRSFFAANRLRRALRGGHTERTSLIAMAARAVSDGHPWNTKSEGVNHTVSSHTGEHLDGLVRSYRQTLTQVGDVSSGIGSKLLFRRREMTVEAHLELQRLKAQLENEKVNPNRHAQISVDSAEPRSLKPALSLMGGAIEFVGLINPYDTVCFENGYEASDSANPTSEYFWTHEVFTEGVDPYIDRIIDISVIYPTGVEV